MGKTWNSATLIPDTNQFKHKIPFFADFCYLYTTGIRFETPSTSKQLIQVTRHIHHFPFRNSLQTKVSALQDPKACQCLRFDHQSKWDEDMMINPKMRGDCSTFRNSSNGKFTPTYRQLHVLKIPKSDEIHLSPGKFDIPWVLDLRFHRFCEVPHGMCWMKSSATCRQGNWDLQKPSGDITLLKGSMVQHLPKYHIGGGFKDFYIFTPKTLRKWSHLTSIFFKWVGSHT